jgi:hypothetical protein
MLTNHAPGAVVSHHFVSLQVDVNRVVHLSAVIVLRRSDKQPDRVEISPEQLSDASTKAEVCLQQHTCTGAIYLNVYGDTVRSFLGGGGWGVKYFLKHICCG